MKISVCLQCGVTFQTYECRRGKFCSSGCYQEYWTEHVLKERILPKRHGSVEVICEYCGNPFKVCVSRYKNQRTRFCSRECFRLYKIEHPEEYAGENHWNWKGGISNENHLLRQTKEYVKWRDAVFKRDGWTCRKCNYKGHDIVAHHILNFHGHPELRFNVGNGMTLCRRCHKKLHYNIGEETRFKRGQHSHNKLPTPPKEELEELYWKQGLSTVKIAKKFNVCHKTIRKWLKHYNIPLRSLSEARLNYLSIVKNFNHLETIMLIEEH